ncbi:MAG: hypothetical protein HFE51_05000 [Clostridia bacterium]|nr:hypothetical protein [Clostridia bacterium]
MIITNITVIDKIDISKVLKEINSPALWTFAANDWYRLISPYTPYDTGQLMQNVTIKPGEIIYEEPYAVYPYNGEHMNFKKDHNPKASARWDQRAIQEKQDEKLTQAVQGYINNKL